MPGEHASAELLGALSGLLGSVDAVPLSLDVPDVVDARRIRTDIITQLSDDYREVDQGLLDGFWKSLEIKL